MSHSSATISAIAVFENGRKVEGMSCIFDAQIFLGKEKPLLAALRYFNRDNREFGDVGFYFITARVTFFVQSLYNTSTHPFLLGCSYGEWCKYLTSRNLSYGDGI